MLDIKVIAENYRKMDNAKIQNLAYNPKGLREEAIPVLIAELQNRGFSDDIIEWVQFETNYFKGAELEKLETEIKESKCTSCFQNTNLKGYHFRTKVSFIVTLVNKEEVKIICQECAKELRIKSVITTFFGGWWSIGGILRTPFVLIKDIYNTFSPNRSSNAIIKDFIYTYTGIIRRHKVQGLPITLAIQDFNKEPEDKNLLENALELMINAT